ncbi:MAG: alkaline phosphatase family protein [Candidatus Villigracilaceae bacterium]
MPKYASLFFLLLFAALFCASCSPAVPAPLAVSSFPTEISLPPEFSLPTPTLTPFQPIPPTATLTPTATVRPVATHVLIISIDGLRPDAIAKAPMPILDGMMQGGAYTLEAQTIIPPYTLPAHASMLTGLCPSQHGVTWDTYAPSKGIAQGVDLFDLAHELGLKTLMIVSKEKLRQVTESKKNVDVFRLVVSSDDMVAKVAVAEIAKGFDLMFVHFDDVDIAGHDYDWDSPKYLEAARRADQALSKLIVALETAGLRDDTLVIVTADHAGRGKNHLESDPEITTIPWILSGTGIRPMVLKEPVSIVDTAATAAWILNIPLPLEWAGYPVTEAFGLPSEPRPAPRCP